MGSEIGLKGKTLLLGVGAQRTGTEWMYNYLSTLPGVSLSPIKELHFFDAWLCPEFCGGFDKEFINRLNHVTRKSNVAIRSDKLFNIIERVRMIRDRRVYFEFMSKFIGSSKAFCEITPSYSMIDAPGFRKIAAFAGEFGVDVKVFFIMRDPIDRYCSALRFQEKMTNGRKTAKENFKRMIDDPNWLLRGRYDRTVENLTKAFGRRNVKFGFYEKIFCEPERYLKDITDFLELEYGVPNVRNKINASTAREEPNDDELQLAFETFAPVYKYVTDYFGSDKPTSWRM